MRNCSEMKTNSPWLWRVGKAWFSGAFRGSVPKELVPGVGAAISDHPGDLRSRALAEVERNVKPYRHAIAAGVRISSPPFSAFKKDCIWEVCSPEEKVMKKNYLCSTSLIEQL